MKLFGAFKNLFQWLKKNKAKIYALASLLQPQIAQQLTNLIVANSNGKITQYKAELFAQAAVTEFLSILGGSSAESIAESVIDKKISDNDTTTRLVAIAKDKANLDDTTANLAVSILLGNIKKLI
jgi:hypothetical protein